MLINYWKKISWLKSSERGVVAALDSLLSHYILNLLALGNINQNQLAGCLKRWFIVNVTLLQNTYSFVILVVTPSGQNLNEPSLLGWLKQMIGLIVSVLSGLVAKHGGFFGYFSRFNAGELFLILLLATISLALALTAFVKIKNLILMNDKATVFGYWLINRLVMLFDPVRALAVLALLITWDILSWAYPTSFSNFTPFSIYVFLFLYGVVYLTWLYRNNMTNFLVFDTESKIYQICLSFIVILLCCLGLNGYFELESASCMPVEDSSPASEKVRNSNSNPARPSRSMEIYQQAGNVVNPAAPSNNVPNATTNISSGAPNEGSPVQSGRPLSGMASYRRAVNVPTVGGVASLNPTDNGGPNAPVPNVSPPNTSESVPNVPGGPDATPGVGNASRLPIPGTVRRTLVRSVQFGYDNPVVYWISKHVVTWFPTISDDILELSKVSPEAAVLLVSGGSFLVAFHWHRVSGPLRAYYNAHYPSAGNSTTVAEPSWRTKVQRIVLVETHRTRAGVPLTRFRSVRVRMLLPEPVLNNSAQQVIQTVAAPSLTSRFARSFAVSAAVLFMTPVVLGGMSRYTDVKNGVSAVPPLEPTQESKSNKN
jgi:hypothetical protein